MSSEPPRSGNAPSDQGHIDQAIGGAFFVKKPL